MKKLLAAVGVLVITAPAFAGLDSRHCLRWKYICTEKDEFGTCVAWETQCLQWGAPPEGPGSPMPIDSGGEGSSGFTSGPLPGSEAGSGVPAYILSSMSRGVESFEALSAGGRVRVINVVRSVDGPR